VSVFELTTGDSISAFDADFHPETPDQGHPLDDFDASGPNRFTIWIPSEQVTVNMGNPVMGASGTHENQTGAPLVDQGFVVQTDNHVHLHTFGFPTSDGRTEPSPTDAGSPVVEWSRRAVLRLGTPPTVPQAVSDYASTALNTIKTPTQIGSAYPAPYNRWNGFAMVTEGAAYQEAQANHVIVSGTADLRLVGERVALLGSPGNVHITASGSSVTDVVANETVDNDSDADPSGESRWAAAKRAETRVDAVITGVSAVLAAGALIDEVFYQQFARSPREGMIGWQGAGFGDWGGMVIKAAGVVGGIGAMVLGFLPDTDSGYVSLYAAKSFKGVGELIASVHGGLLTSVSGGGATLVSADGIVSVSSLAIASMSSTFTSVSGLLSATLSSQWGTAKVVGRKATEISSSGKVFVAGKGDVQVNSTDGKVFVHGRLGFYLGAGAAPSSPVSWSGFGPINYEITPGYGIIGTASSLTLGRMNSAGLFSSGDGPGGGAPSDPSAPYPDASTQVLIQDDQILLQHKTASITLKDNQVSVGANGASRVLIG
jgi:hypothetical protein